MSNLVVLSVALLVNTLVLSKVASTFFHGSGRISLRRATDTTTNFRVVDTVTSRHVVLHP